MAKPYLDYFYRNNHQILMMIERDGMSLKEVAQQYSVTTSFIRQKYRMALRRKMEAYAEYIAEVYEQDYTEVRNTFFDYHHLYGDSKYSLAYVESLYPDVLEDFRAGEPGSSYDISHYKTYEKEPPAVWPCLEDAKSQSGKHDYFSESRRTGLRGFEQYRITLSSLEKRVMRWRDEDGLSYIEIGTRLKTTREKSADIYLTAAMVQFRAYTFYLCWFFDLDYDDTMSQLRTTKIRRNQLRQDLLQDLYAEHGATYPPTAEMILEANRKRRKADRQEQRRIRQLFKK